MMREGSEKKDRPTPHRGPVALSLDLVVFAGPNGCGKTSILHACLLALGKGEVINTPASNDIHIGTDQYTI